MVSDDAPPIAAEILLLIVEPAVVANEIPPSKPLAIRSQLTPC